MAIIHVDGKQYEVSGSDNLLQACLSLGLDIPYFCWHPALGSVGACRQCAVKQFKDEGDKHGRIVMSCMSPAANNTYISVADPEAVEFRASVVEFLMTNHPHDCPVCEEGGHCHLQDMTVMTGHHSRKYRYDKRTHLNQDLGPFVGHEMNRCIACYRCVRFYKDYAGGTDLGVFGTASNVYFGRAEDGVLESEFSGNLTEVCPTGVFTDKTHSEKYTRKWDMQFAPSICSGCAVGCNVSPGERYGEIRRIENRYHGELNGYFLCDRGRFGYGYTNREDRPRQVLQKRGAAFAAVDPKGAVAQTRELLQQARRTLGIGSPRASIEANFALRQLVGEGNFFSGMGRQEHELVALALDILRQGAVRPATIRGIEQADAVLVLGEDVTQTAPRVALALRQAARNRMASEGAKKNIPEWQVIALADLVQDSKNPVFIATPTATRLDDIGAATWQAAPRELALLGQAIAHHIDPKSAAPQGLSAQASELAQRIADTLKAAARPLVVSGTGAGSAEVMQAAANIATALKAAGGKGEISLAIPEANSLGLAMFGAPSADEAFATLARGEAEALVVLENDLYRRAPEAVVDAALAKVQTLVVIDHQLTRTSERAQIVLPAGTVFETDGTFVNFEGRAQRHFQVFDPGYYKKEVATQESWRWADDLAGAKWDTLDDVTAACAAALPQFAAIRETAPNAKFRIRGMKLARAPHRYSGRTAQRANISVHEPRQLQDKDSALAFSMEGVNGSMGVDRPPELLPFAWAPGWNSPQAWNKFQAEVGGSLIGGDPGEFVFAAGQNSAAGYFPVNPAAPAAGELRALPLHHIFGSEEQSARCLPIQQRMPAPYVLLNADEAQRLGLNGKARVTVDGQTVELPVHRAPLPAGTVGLPQGLPGIPFFAGGTVVSVAKGGAKP
ncbi:MAG TPA: NADH-quinone oxidoreductase subunit NuoG [Solimonas sp.]|nr:NADH-quinone oxidoreductase subunit NuoG [Solimonas sp.]